MEKADSSSSALIAARPSLKSARKGYLRLRDIPPALLYELNQGKVETSTLTEQAAMDFAMLLQSLGDWAGNFQALVRGIPDLRLNDLGVVARMRAAGLALGEHGGFSSCHALGQLMAHPSDTVRGFSCFIVAAHSRWTMEEKFQRIRILAADSHFGVREWAWLAMRPLVAESPLAAVGLLRSWVSEPDANLRRFAVEVTRPRGVWARHIPLFVKEPERGLTLLEPCRCDPGRYVQDSVANWLNDSAKSRPDWVKEICAWWEMECPEDKACRYIVRRALRSIR